MAQTMVRHETGSVDAYEDDEWDDDKDDSEGSKLTGPELIAYIFNPKTRLTFP